MMRFASKMVDKVHGAVANRVFRPAIKIEPVSGLIRLGSSYGGWTIKNDAYLDHCFAISCGLGEDASFDVEFAARYGADVIIVDPTPRSVIHYRALFARIGTPATKSYVKGGAQPVEAYDLSNVRSEQLRLEEKALWTNEEPVRFYQPSNPAHVSHSVKFKPKGEEEKYILVPTVTIGSLLADVPKEKFGLLKMDIEGAETEILATLRQWPALPRQILVEFDILRKPGSESKAEVERIDALLRHTGYTCCHYDGDRNYLYLR